MGDENSHQPKPVGWTRNEVIGLVTLLVGFPAAIVAVVAIAAVSKRRYHRRRSHHSRGIESVRYGESSGSTSGSALVAQGSKDRGRMCRVEDVGLQELASQSEGTEIHISSDDARDPLGLSVVGVKHSDRLGRCRLRLGRDASLVANDKPVASMAQGDKLQPKKAVEWTRRGDLTMWFKEEFDMINAQTAREKDEWADELMSKVVATPQSSVSRDRFRTIDVQDSTKSTGTA